MNFVLCIKFEFNRVVFGLIGFTAPKLDFKFEQTIENEKET